MTKMTSTITLRPDSFFKDPRVVFCRNDGCEYSTMHKKGREAFSCQLREIDIGREGKCNQFKLLSRPQQ